MTVKAIMETVRITRKQDLAYLQGLAAGAERTVFPQELEREGGEDARKAEWEAIRRLTHVDIDATPSLSLDFLTEEMESMPVCGLLLEGFPIHPVNVANSKGKVSAALTFGGEKRVPQWYQRLLNWVDPDDLGDAVNRAVYTRGEAAGFEKRLEEQTTRPCVSGLMRTKGARVIRAPKIARRALRESLPIRSSDLWDWHQDLQDLFLQIETSSISSAGAPYWKKKPDAMEEMMVGVMPLVHQALTEGTLDALFKAQPELFLGQVKNKLDRYDPMKLKDKCRPYFTLPFHWQALFSMLSQPFTHALRQFHEDPAGKCANAYGFSWAHGGGSKAVSWASRVKNGEMRFYAYGDDCDVYYREKGRLWRVSPDFRQMDGSVDADTVRETVRYVLDSFTAKWGPSLFWEEVGKMWVEFATNPLFVVHGTKIWKKPQEDGLMTGVVGTTLFDTAKSVLAYSDFRDQYELGERHLVGEKEAIAFFAKRGLEIKEGTWVPHPVLEHPTPGELVSPNKFLGIQLLWAQGPEEVEPVPYLEYEDWLTLLACPRDDPCERDRSGGGAGARSGLARERLWFDRLRGYMITGGFSNPAVRSLLNGMVNTIDPVAVLMRTQACRGKGQKPEDFNVCGDDFEFPDSEGYPNWRWCENLYFSDSNQWGPDQAKWMKIFPTLETRISEFHNRWTPMKPVMAVHDLCYAGPDAQTTNPFVNPASDVRRSVLEVGLIEPPEEFRDPPEMVPGTAKPSPKRDPAKVAERSAILDVQPSTSGLVREPKTRMPTTADLLEEIFKTARPPVKLRTKHRIARHPDAEPFYFWEHTAKALREHLGDDWMKVDVWRTPVLTLAEVAARLGNTEGHAAAVCRKCGFYVLGKKTRIVSRVPLELADPGERRTQEKQTEENKSYARVVSQNTSTVAKTVLRARQLPAEMPQGVVEVVSAIPLRPAEGLRTSDPPAQQLSQVVNANKMKLVWVSRNVTIEGEQMAETKLSVGTDVIMNEVARMVGPSGSANRESLSRWALGELLAGPPIPPSKKATQNRDRLKRRQEETRQANAVGDEGEEAWFTTAGHPILREVKGRLRPGPSFQLIASLGWTEVSGAVAAPNAKDPLSRGRETHSAFLMRVKRLLESDGLARVQFTPPKDSKPPPQTCRNGQISKKQEASGKAPPMSTKSAPHSEGSKKPRRR